MNGMCRVTLIAALAALPACRAARRPAVDVWALAPNGTTLVMVMSMHGYERLGAATRVMYALGPAPPDRPASQMEESFVVTAARPPASVGLAPDGQAATFEGPWGEVEIWPTVDAARFHRERGGETRDGVHHFHKETCKEVRGVYACAEDPANLDRIGDGPGLPRPAIPTALRHDVVTVAVGADAPQTKIAHALVEISAPIVLVVQLDDGTAAAHLMIRGKPRGALARLVDAPRHRLRTDGLSSFVAIGTAYAAATPLPRHEAMAQTEAVEAWTPTGGGGAQVTVRFRDPAPAAGDLATCGDGEPPGFFSHDPLRPGECQVRLPAPYDIEATAWMEGDLLRAAGVRGPGQPGPTLATEGVAGRLAARPWSAVLWVRGTFATELSRLGILPLALTNAGVVGTLTEVGIGVDVQADRVEAVAVARTSYAEPDAVRVSFAAALVGEAAQRAARLDAFAATHGASRLADDVRAGSRGGMLVAQVPGLLIGGLAAAIPEAKLMGDEAGDR